MRKSPSCSVDGVEVHSAFQASVRLLDLDCWRRMLAVLVPRYSQIPERAKRFEASWWLGAHVILHGAHVLLHTLVVKAGVVRAELCNLASSSHLA